MTKYHTDLRFFFASFILLFGVVFTSPASAQVITNFQTVAEEAIVVDGQTGSIIFEKNADMRMPTSSMSKVMTAIIVFDGLRDGRLTLDTKLLVSEKAWRKGGSKMFVEQGTQVAVEDLIRGVITQSGNDATIVLAEGLSGSEENFVKLMNQKAKQLGMDNTNFANASGWPDPDHYSTARDLMKMAIYLVNNYPEYYHYYAEEEFTFNGIKQPNRNPLLYRDLGADGIKTGHTEAAGFGLIGSAVQDGRRIYMVLNGMDSIAERGSESARIMAWAFRNTENVRLISAGQKVDEAHVWLGKNNKIPLIVLDDLVTTIAKTGQDTQGSIQARVSFDNPIPAPVAKGEKVATLILEMPGGQEIEQPLYAGADSRKLGLLGQAVEKIRYALLGLE